MDCYIFDLDGTLIDSEPACSRALLDLLPDLTDDLSVLIGRYRGKRLADICADVETRIGRSLPAAFEKSYRARVTEIFETELQAMPGAIEALGAVNRPMCVASSGPVSKIRHALDLVGLSRFFGQNIFSSYDVGSWKPDPGLFLYAANAMRVAPSRCVVIEDSTVGIAAALLAGMRAVQYLPHEGHPAAEGAFVIHDLRQLADVRFDN
ncbi:HAD-IA family hydrolase [Methylosinus sp. H3A]|uniref:HAD-IA family hydrolase n=1 Tax=Methylosinus sp. H3A TaxID=2785786 RepID=UPI0018C33C82|nr:HAD-IA family hydrolase [Methylosinus sp. H3A]MBG0810358.1 HAD-IA family hydrolase [Methylosinus sp. H3A]